jgi:hypothetical protein
MPMDLIKSWFGGKPQSNVIDLCAHLAARGEGAKPLDLTAHLSVPSRKNPLAAAAARNMRLVK